MKRLMLAAAVVVGCGQAHAAVKACGDLKSEIATKLDVLGVKSYELKIADKGETGGGKVVGSCENSSKKITYIKYAQQQKAAVPSAAAAQERQPAAEEKTVTALAAAHSRSSAIKDCGELKNEIEAKLAANGVKSYELKIADKGEAVGGGKVVGSCENSSKVIIYIKK